MVLAVFSKFCGGISGLSCGRISLFWVSIVVKQPINKQVDEVLILDGIEVKLLSRPLSSWLLEASVRFDQHRNVSLARGYRGTWTLHQDKLYLVTLCGHLREGNLVEMGDLFPHSHGQPVLADWFSGELRVPRGDAVPSYDLFNPVIYPWEIRFTIAEGLVTDRKMFKNDVPLVTKPMEHQVPWWKRIHRTRS